MVNLASQNIFVHTLKGSLTCPKILQYGADGFTSHQKKGMLHIFIALKIHCPQSIYVTYTIKILGNYDQKPGR
jgi:hypothetical protein